MDEPRIVVAGAGVQMRRHLVPALAQLGCTIAAVIDPDMDKARQLALSVGAPAAATLAAAAHLGRIDAIVAACTPGGHEQLIRDAIGSGVPTLAEKPPAASGAALRELARLARAAGVPVCVGMNYRHAPGFQALRARLRGRNRRVEYAHVMHLVPGGQIAGWGLDPVRCFMLAQAIHPVDQALALIGAPETADVAASRDHHGRIRATWTLRRRDRVATIHVGNAGPGFRNTVTACGSDGLVAELRNLDELSVIEGAGRREFREQSLRRTPFADVLDRLGFAASVAGFLAAHAGLDVPEGGTELVHLDDLVGCYDLLESAIASCAGPAEEE
jgi:phthalate 4,5-cis-dihydrodiol dehydrogenase